MRYLILVAFSIQAVFLIPMLVGVLADNLSFDASQLGGIAAADLAGFSLACLWVFIQGSHLCWKRVIAVSAITVVAINLTCIVVDDFWGLFALRVIAGFGAGAAYGIAMIAVARSPGATSLFGWAMAAQGLVAMLSLAALPHLLDLFGMPVLFGLLAVMALICGLVSPGLEPILLTEQELTVSRSNHRGVHYLSGAVVLGGIFALFLGQGGFTAFIERIGADSGLSREFIGYSLAASSFSGVVAGVIAALQAQKLGLRFPLLVVFVGQALAVWLLWQPFDSYWSYLLVLVLYNFCWVYVVPFHMSIVANQDSNGRLIALAPAVQGAGLSFGAALSGGLLDATTGYSSLYLFILMTGLVSLLLVSGVIVQQRRTRREVLEAVV